MNKINKKIIWLTLASTLLFIQSCTQPKILEERTIAQVSEKSEELDICEKIKILMNNPNTHKNMIISELDKLVVLLVQNYNSLTTFEFELDSMLERKKINPNDSNLDPLQTTSYQNLIKARILKDKYEHYLVHLYESAFSSLMEIEKNEVRTKNARLIIKTINDYLKDAEILQQVELQTLMKEIKAYYKKTVSEYKRKQLNQAPSKVKIQEISGLTETVIFDSKIVDDPEKLARLEKRSRRDRQLKKSNFSDKYNMYIDTINEELNEIDGPTFDQRSPNSIPAQTLSCLEDKRKICISTGEEGNIIGKIFPPGVWSFTYDDGPDPVLSNKIMDLFLNYKDRLNPRGQVTFFWTAKNALANQTAVARAISNDIPVENHSYDHANLSKQNTSGRIKQIINSNTVLESIAQKTQPDYKIRYFRCPYGACYNPAIPQVRQMLVDQRQIHVYWRIDSLDWQIKNGPRIADLVIKQMKLQNHGVVLMHDVHPTTVDATKIILNWIKTSNNSGATQFKLVTIPQAVDLVNGK